MQRFYYVLNSDGVGLATVADYVCNFLVKTHAHLCSILHGMYSSYGLMEDGYRMGIHTVAVEDGTSESRAANLSLN